MSRAIFNMRKHWLALSAVTVLVAIVLTAGALFAANERPRPELPAPGEQQKVADTADPGLADDLPVVVVPPERVLVQPDDQEVETDLPPIVEDPPRYPNLDANLNRLAEQAQATDQQSDTFDPPAEQSTPKTADSILAPASPAEPVLVTFYVEPEQLATVQQFLEGNDVFIRNIGEDYVEALILPALLPAASELPGVRRVDTVMPPQPDQSSSRGAVSQGVALHQADAWHRMGFRGQGIKVGVIDGGFDGFRELQRSGRLPGNVIARCYPPRDSLQPVSSFLADCEVGSAHGTAVAETVIDVAPEVQLYIANPRSSGDLKNAVDWMVDNRVNVINRSLRSIYQGPGDGTYYFSDSVLRSVDTAVSRGIVFVNSGGNTAKRGWYGAFKDPDGNNFHNFNTRQGAANFFPLRFSEDEGRDIFAQMRWEDSWGGADCNLDLYLAKFVPGRGYEIVTIGNDEQDGQDSDVPRELVVYELPSVSEEGVYALFIVKRNCVNEPDWIQLEAWDIPELGYYSPGHHVGNPAESRNPGMLAVGATHWGSPGVIASYSSRGPTTDGRIKPDITGIACGRSTVYPPRTRDGTECWFPGTSQAAPHVSGLAALVKQRFPDYTPAQVADYLKKHADERDSLGADNTWGHGLAILPPAPEPTLRGSPPTPEFYVCPSNDPRCTDDIPEGQAIISWVPVPDATHYRIGYINMEVDLYLAEEASCTNEADDWLQAFIYVDVKAPNVPVRNGRAEWTIRRLSPGAEHAFTVLASNNLYNNKLNVGADFSWPQRPRWLFVDGRDERPPGLVIPQLDCPP